MSRRVSSVLLLACAVLISSLALAAVALGDSGSGSGTPTLDLVVNQPTTELYGNNIPITLTASNPTGQAYGYNLSFSDVLPAGVTYVPGSSTGNGGAVADPQIVTNPSTGAQTLIWSDLGDLSAGSSYPLSFKVNAANSSYDVGGAAPNTSGTVTDQAQAFVNSDPRYVPKFTSTGAPQPLSSTSATGESAAVSTSTRITAIQIQKSGPATLLRGVHDHQGVYTLTVTNNNVNPTDSVTVTDWLPADLEFLGCGGANVDNTTNADGTNPGSPDEYPGSGPIQVASVANCIQPTSVQTVSTTPTDPAGNPIADANGDPMTAGVYTEVTWTLNDLTPGQVVQIPYTAAVPIRENTLNWAASSTGTATITTAPAITGAQAVNLDNNNGPETYHNEPIVNGSEVTGDYQDPADAGASIPTYDTSVLSGVAKDIVESKTVSSPTLIQGATPTYTLTVSTSEYRFYDNLTVTDTLPNGQCPLGSQNFENQQSSECDPVSGLTPSSPYTTVKEQVGSGGSSADGTYNLSWNDTTDPDLTQIPVNGTVKITFPVRTLRYYQQNGADDTSTPILSGDSVTNTTAVSGTDFVRCTGGASPEDCPNGTQISHDQVTSNGTTDDTIGTAAASASQSALEPTIEKEVAAALPADGKCSDATYQTTIATYGYGDEVCWELTVNFPAGTDTRDTTLNDFLPNGLTVVDNSGVATANDTVPFTETDSTSAPQVAFTVCPSSNTSAACGPSANDIARGGTFQVTFASTQGSPDGHLSGDVQGNLMKFANANTAGVTDPLRAEADFQFSVPTLGLAKTIAKINATSEPAGTTSATVNGGDTVTYQAAVTNSGTAAAQSAVIWDDLPAGETCANVVTSSSYSCVDAATSPSNVPAHIVFTPAFVAAGSTVDLSFQVQVPSTDSPAQALSDTAGVTSYTSTDNTGGTENYYPANDLDPSLTLLSNSPAANSSATVTLASPGLSKTGSSAIHEVSTADATIGEPITYQISSTLPKNTTLYGGVLSDTVPTTLSVNDSSVTATLDGNPLPAGATLTVNGNAISVNLGSSYTTTSAGDTVAISFSATVVDSAANLRADVITNTTKLAWNDAENAPHSVSASARTTVVEPNLHITKTSTAGATVTPGQTVTFTVTPVNTSATDVSPAHDVAVTDTVPSGVTVLNMSGNPAADGDTVSSVTNAAGTTVTGVYTAASNTITWSDIGNLAVGASLPLTYKATVNQDPAAGQTLTNTATDTADSLPAGTTGERTSASSTHTGYTATASDTLTAAGPSILKTASPTSAAIGQTVTYTATVTLPANTDFNDLTILDTLPNGLSFGAYGTVSCSAAITNCAATTLSSTAGSAAGSTNIGWYVGQIGPFSTSQTITVTYTGVVASSYANGSAVVDTNSLVNHATVQTDTTQKLTTAPSSPPAAASFTNSYGPATAPVSVIEPRLGITKTVVDGAGSPAHTATADPEDTLTYAVTVTNSGDAPAYAANVQDTPPASLTGVQTSSGVSTTDLTQAWTAADPTMKWAIPGPIAPGASVTFTYTATVPDGVTDGELIKNTASVPSYSSLPGAPAGSRTYTADPSDSDTVTVAAPTLAIAKTPTSATAIAGSGDSYTVTVSNTGHATAKNVTVADTVPAGMTYTAGSATAATDAAFAETSDTAGSGGTTIVDWALGSIPAGSSVAITVPVSFPADTPDPTTLTNSATAASTNTANSPKASAPITVHASADLQAIKSVATSPIPAGGQDTYTLTVKNNGPSDAQGVTLTDPLPASETFVSADSGCTNTNNTVTCIAGTVASGASASFHVTVSVSPTVTGPIANTLTVASSTPDPNPANNSATIAPDSISQADVSVTKSANGIQFDGGDTVTYTVTASNSGPASAVNVVITDPLPSAVTFQSADSGCTDTDNTVNCSIASLAVGATKSFQIKATVNGSAPPAATPGTGDEQLAVSKVEQGESLQAGQTGTFDLTCSNGGLISDGNVLVQSVDQGTGTLASVQIVKSWATSAGTYEFTLANTATGQAQVQLEAICLPATTTADQNGNTHPLITGNQVTSTQTLSQGDHTITVDVGNADVPIAPSFRFLSGTGTVQGSEGSSSSSVWTYTIDVTSPSAQIEVGSTPLQVQPGAAGGFTNDLQFTSVSQQVTVAPNSTATVSVICPNGYEGIEATYTLPDGLVLLGDDPQPITRVYSLYNTTNQTLSGTLDMLCLADRTGPEVDYLGPVINTATASETNVDPNSANNSGSAAIRIDRAVGSAATPAPASGGHTQSAPATGASSAPTSAAPSSGSTSTSSTSKASSAPSGVKAAAMAPVVKSVTLALASHTATVHVSCSAEGGCAGTAWLLIPGRKSGQYVSLAKVTYTITKGHTVRLTFHLSKHLKLTAAQRRNLTLSLRPKGGKLVLKKLSR